MKKIYSDEQIEALRRYYPDSEYDELQRFFPGFSLNQIRYIANNYGIRKKTPGRRKDLCGQTFGDLTVIELDHIDEKYRVWWKCSCTCGRESVVRAGHLTSGSIKSCGCKKQRYKDIDYTGQKFGLLTAVERMPHYKGSARTCYRCICDCGNESMVLGSALVSGHTKSCGCSRTRK